MRCTFSALPNPLSPSTISGQIQELEQALSPFAKIRRAVGNRMDIMVEFHSLWSLPMAKKLAARLAEFDTYWHEDPFRLAVEMALKLDGYAAKSYSSPEIAIEALKEELASVPSNR